MTLQHISYEYKCNSFHKLAEDPLRPLSDDWAESLEEAGYSGVCGDGKDVLAVHEADRATPLTERWAYLVDFSPCRGVVHTIFVEDLPSLTDLLAKLSPYAAMCNADAFNAELRNVMDKAFRAMHGHSTWSVCDECDPEGAKRRRELSAARKARKAL